MNKVHSIKFYYSSALKTWGVAGLLFGTCVSAHTIFLSEMSFSFTDYLTVWLFFTPVYTFIFLVLGLATAPVLFFLRIGHRVELWTGAIIALLGVIWFLLLRLRFSNLYQPEFIWTLVLVTGLCLLLCKASAFLKSKSKIIPSVMLAVIASLAGAGFLVGEVRKSRERLVDPQQVGSLYKPNDRKLLLIGIDAASWEIIDPMIAGGELPNFAALIQQGTRAPLKTQIPTASLQIWTSMATGKKPATHGLIGWKTFNLPFCSQPLSRMTEGVGLGNILRRLWNVNLLHFSRPSSKVRRVKAFWNILSDYGISVATVGWWCTSPVEKVNGILVSDNLTYSLWSYDQYKDKTLDVFPSTMYDELYSLVHKPDDIPVEDLQELACISPERARQIKNAGFNPREKTTYLKYAYQSDRSYIDIAHHILRKYDPRLLAVYLNGLDPVEHRFWHTYRPEDFEIGDDELAQYGSVIPFYYKFLDKALERFLLPADMSDRYVILISDHGMESSGRLPISGQHDNAPDGIFVVSGPGVEKGFVMDRFEYLDLTPTILSLLGLPSAQDMDGEDRSGEFLEPRACNGVVQEVATYGSQREYPGEITLRLDSEIQEKLKSLGYVQ